MKKRILIGLAVIVGAALIWAGLLAHEEYSENKRIERSFRFDGLERAYWPEPIDIKGQNVLLIAYDSFNVCSRECSYLFDGSADATIYYAIYDFPDQPDFSQALDLISLVQGKLVPDQENTWRAKREASTERPARIDRVIIDMSQALSPILNAALDDFYLKRSWGTAHVVIAPVPDDRAFQLSHLDVDYIKFHRDKILGRHNSWHGNYSFTTRIDPDDADRALRHMLCDSDMEQHAGCRRDD